MTAGFARLNAAELGESARLFDRVVKSYSRTHGPTHQLTVQQKMNQASVQRTMEEAAAVAAEIASLFPRVPAPATLHPEDAVFSLALARLYNQRRWFVKAEKVLRPAFAHGRRTKGLADPGTWRLGEELSMVLGVLGKIAGAPRQLGLVVQPTRPQKDLDEESMLLFAELDKCRGALPEGCFDEVELCSDGSDWATTDDDDSS